MKKLPNILTILRVLLIIPFVAAYYINVPYHLWAGFGIFVLAAVTDFLDGYLARKLKVTSSFGRFLDPIADKLIVVAAILVLLDAGMINGWHTVAAIIIIGREIFVSGLREFLGGKKVVHVSILAKIKTALQLISLAGILYVKALDGWLSGLDIMIASMMMFWVTAFISLKTGYDYYRAARPYFKK